MKIAFYAPLKPPDHPVPSGDREIARSLMQALRRGGHDVVLASRFRSFDAQGDARRQARLQTIGRRLAERVAARFADGAPPDAWFTYHVYHKAPDHLGAFVSAALSIPYVVAEASIAPGERDGPWAAGYADAHAAIRAADVVLCLNPKDAAQVRRARAPGARLEMLAPFIDVERFVGEGDVARVPRPARAPVRLVTVAMMRDGAKLASYRVLAQALGSLAGASWTLDVIGDGPARAAVVAAFAPLADRVRFLGQQRAAALPALFAMHDVFVWPAIDEAIGVVFLEAQACGLPVVGGDSPGVAAVVANGRSGLLAPIGDAAAFASTLQRLLHDDGLRSRLAAYASAYVRDRHDVHAAACDLDRLLRTLTRRPQRAAAAPAC
ncbi:MAG: glycosyltransferase family 4 protein [Rudaea sp.]